MHKDKVKHTFISQGANVGITGSEYYGVAKGSVYFGPQLNSSASPVCAERMFYLSVSFLLNQRSSSDDEADTRYNHIIREKQFRGVAKHLRLFAHRSMCSYPSDLWKCAGSIKVLYFGTSDLHCTITSMETQCVVCR